MSRGASPIMTSERPIHTIVLDAGPILQNSPSVSTLLSNSTSLVTTPGVIAEIRDQNARSRFETTLQPFVTIENPSPLSVKFVTDFARKTGDLAVLSKTDIEIMALVYELECVRNKGDLRIRKAPGQKRLNGQPPETEKAVERLTATDTSPEPANTSQSTRAAPWAEFPILVPECEQEALDVFENQAHASVENEDVNATEAPAEAASMSLDDLKIEDPLSEPGSMAVSNIEEPPYARDLPHEIVESSDSDSEGWITPSNIQKVQAAEIDGHSTAICPETTMQVAIITADFAMQNVLLQIGLNLLSPTLQRIRTIRTYILRCHACFQTVKDTSKQFCPRCGKPALTRVSCSTTAKGGFRIHLKKNMQWNHRGDRYSIPKPVPGQANGKVGQGRGGGKGGWGQELILTEDQKEYQRAMGVNGRSKGTDLMDEHYLPGLLTGKRDRPRGRPKVGAGRNVNSKKRV